MPLTLPQVRPGQACPATQVRQIAIREGQLSSALGDGPIYVVGGQDVRSDPARSTKVAWVADPAYSGPIRIRGRQLEGTEQILLGGPDNHWPGAPVKTIEGTDLYPELDFLETHTNPSSPWRQWPSATYVATPGCYAWQVDGIGFSETIVVRASFAALGQPGCQPPSPIDSPASGPGPEVEGTSPDAELWALLFASPPIHAGDEVKIVWRLTGSGALRIAGMGPAGTAARLTFGPQQHSGSNWTRPGDEWGTGFVFPSPGCWDIHAARDNATGDVWLLVQ